MDYLVFDTESAAQTAADTIYANMVAAINSPDLLNVDTMDYLVFDTEEAAQTAADTIYTNMVMAINSPDLLNVDTGQVVEKDSLTPEQTVEQDAQNRFYPIFGVNAYTGQKNPGDGYTTAWAVPQLTVQGNWVFAKPDDALMTGVVGYIVEPFDPNWFASATNGAGNG